MLRPFHSSNQPSPFDAGVEPGSLLRRLREDPQEAIGHIAGDIGARRATSLGEAQVAAYLDGRLRRAGLRVSADAFRSASGAGWDGLAIALVALCDVILYYWQPLPALALAILIAAFAIFGLLRPSQPLLARKRPSQNVVGTRAILGVPRWRVVLLAPLDSPAPMARLARALGRRIQPAPGRVAACALIALLAGLALLQLPIEARRALWYGQILATAYLLLSAALDIWSERAPATPGATNHAGALAALLSSAEALSALQQTELWAIGLGATSTGAGLADVLRRYPFDRDGTLFIGVESIGGGRLSYVTREGFWPQRPADPQLLRLVAQADAADPLIDAEPRPYHAEPTLTHALLADGRRAISLIGLESDGRPALRGSPADTPERVDSQMIDRAIRLIVGLVKQIDLTA